MANHTYNNTANWKILPANSILLWIDGEYHEFKNIAENSYYKISPITRPDDIGGNRTIALRFDGKFSIAENNIEDMSASLIAMSIGDAEAIFIELKALPGQQNGERLTIMPDETGTSINDWSFEWEVNSDEGNLNLELKVSGILSLDSLSASLSLFQQYWS